MRSLAIHPRDYALVNMKYDQVLGKYFIYKEELIVV